MELMFTAGMMSEDWKAEHNTGGPRQFFTGKFSNIGSVKKHERTGRPFGESSFIKELEQSLGRRLTPQKPGPKRKEE